MSRPILIGLFTATLAAVPVWAVETGEATPPSAIQPSEPQVAPRQASPDDVMLRVAQAAHQRFAEMAAAASDENFHVAVSLARRGRVHASAR